MAVPHVVGAAAVLRGTRPDLTVAQIKTALLDFGDPLAVLSGKTVSGKRLNLYNSLLSVYDIVPDSFSFGSKTGVTLTTVIT